jgi:hypothetical protein
MHGGKDILRDRNMMEGVLPRPRSARRSHHRHPDSAGRSRNHNQRASSRLRCFEPRARLECEHLEGIPVRSVTRGRVRRQIAHREMRVAAHRGAHGNDWPECGSAPAASLPSVPAIAPTIACTSGRHVGLSASSLSCARTPRSAWPSLAGSLSSMTHLQTPRTCEGSLRFRAEPLVSSSGADPVKTSTVQDFLG